MSSDFETISAWIESTALPKLKSTSSPNLSTKENEWFSYGKTLENKSRELDIWLRRIYAIVFLAFIIAASVVTYLFIYWIGKKQLVFELAVTIEIVPLVFLNVLSVIFIIVRYLFPTASNKDKH